jgi:hypothetical protein
MMFDVASASLYRDVILTAELSKCDGRRFKKIGTAESAELAMGR